ncbi:hypothetical protein H072_4052 [Dactylellina haptotyla CBS 200.50]|uniref:Uncharacterized protein n=1 Tax=Dactylellina haptotyla (strain CBS 200.50) TaxID=1284197 RepID=S8ALM3_DACHA|nr:hypothetical protein H072_4052 [Dactylellina haptotyla CBS 200.50]
MDQMAHKGRTNIAIYPILSLLVVDEWKGYLPHLTNSRVSSVVLDKLRRDEHGHGPKKQDLVEIKSHDRGQNRAWLWLNTQPTVLRTTRRDLPENFGEISFAI